MLQEVEAVFWIDSSIRPRDTNITRWTQVFDVARKSGIVLFDHTGHAITNYTHPQMFDYLPANVNKLEEIQMLGACVILIFRTQKVSVMSSIVMEPIRILDFNQPYHSNSIRMF